YTTDRSPSPPITAYTPLRELQDITPEHPPTPRPPLSHPPPERDPQPAASGPSGGTLRRHVSHRRQGPPDRQRLPERSIQRRHRPRASDRRGRSGIDRGFRRPRRGLRFRRAG